MNKLLLIIDLQKGFINKRTSFLPSKINKLIESNKFNKVVFTRFINSPDNICYRRLNFKKCVAKKEFDLAIKKYNYQVLDKHTYTAYNNQLIKYIHNNKIDYTYICGIDTDCCVLKTALDLFENNYDIKVLKKYCASTGGRYYHNRAIKIMKRNLGKKNVI